MKVTKKELKQQRGFYIHTAAVHFRADWRTPPSDKCFCHTCVCDN